MTFTRMILQNACEYGAAEACQRQGVTVIAGKGLWVKYTGSEASSSSSSLSVFLGCFSHFPLLYLVSHPFSIRVRLQSLEIFDLSFLSLARDRLLKHIADKSTPQ